MHDICVVFDVDDTLYLEQDYVASGFRAVGDWAAMWLSIPDFGDRCVDLFQSGHRGNIFNAALESCGHPAPPDLISGLVAIYRSHHPKIALLGDARLALDRIYAHWPIAVITDGPVVAQSRKCEALELTKWANPIVLTGTKGEAFHKPQQGAFDFVRTQIVAANYVYVADNPAKDFTAPRKLGWGSIRIRRERGLHCTKADESIKPDVELPDCSNLPQILCGLVAIHKNLYH